MARTLRREIRPTQAAAFPRIAINIERQRVRYKKVCPVHGELEHADIVV